MYELKSETETNPTRARLRLLERIAGKSRELGEWGKNIRATCLSKRIKTPHPTEPRPTISQ